MIKLELQQLCSKHFLTKSYPDNWHEMNETEQLNFIEDHLWQPLENYSPEMVYGIIEDAAKSTQTYIDSLTNQNAITISWHIDDVRWQLGEINNRRETNYQLSDSQCRDILSSVERRHNANIGINWDVLEFWIDEYLTEKHNTNIIKQTKTKLK